MIAQRPDNPYPVDPTGPLTIGSIPEEDLGPLFDATVTEADEPYTYRDALFPEDTVTVRIAKGQVFDGRAYVRVAVLSTDDGDDANGAVLLDAGTAVVMALDLLNAAAEVMHTDPGPFRRMTEADHVAASVALYSRRNYGGEGE